MITISYFWMNAHVVALTSPSNVVLPRGVTWTLEPDYSRGEDGPHGVERHDHRHHAEQVKIVTDPEERSSRLPPTGLASSWIAANEKSLKQQKNIDFQYFANRFKPDIVSKQLIEYLGGVDARTVLLPLLHDLGAHHVQLLLHVLQAVVQAAKSPAVFTDGEVLGKISEWDPQIEKSSRKSLLR